MGKTKRNHPKYSYYHTKKRMMERYDYNDLTESEYNDMCINCIKSKKVNTEVTPKGNQDTYLMNYKNIIIVAVYQTWKKQISTVLPLPCCFLTS